MLESAKNFSSSRIPGTWIGKRDFFAADKGDLASVGNWSWQRQTSRFPTNHDP